MLDNKTIVQRDADSLTHYQILLYDFFFHSTIYMYYF